MRRAALLLAWVVPSLLAQNSPSVVGVGNFIHVVADLDKTMAFYGGTLGLERTGAAGPRTFSRNDLVEKLYDAKGAESRVAVYRIPGTMMGLEFVEFKGIYQKPFHPKEDEHGAATLKLPSTTHTGTMEDPDGFYIEFVKPGDGVPPVELTIRTLDLANIAADVRPFHVTFAEPHGEPTVPLVHDPGSGVLRLLVRDVDASALSWKLQGLPVASADGQIAIANDRHYVIFHNPEGFFFQLFPAPK